MAGKRQREASPTERNVAGDKNTAHAPEVPQGSHNSLPNADPAPARNVDIGQNSNTYSAYKECLPPVASNYLSPEGYTREVKLKEYRKWLMSNYKPLHPELSDMDPANFFEPSFLSAIEKNTEESFRDIIIEPFPGILTFAMLQPGFCKKLVDEVANFQKWVHGTDITIMKPTTMHNYGTVLDDIGMETMLDKLMKDFIQPISKVFFPEFGGATLDFHHGFVVEYGAGRDDGLDIHIDDSEVTLTVCLSKDFSRGDLFFQGVRCYNHLNTATKSEELKESQHHFLGRAILYRGRHRHGARATSKGHRLNLVMWCRSSSFREQIKHQEDFSEWCGACKWRKEVRQKQSVEAMKKQLTR